MMDYIKIFGHKVSRKSLLYKALKLVAKSGPYVAPYLTPKKFEISKVDIPIIGLNSAFQHLKILHLSDIHAGPYFRAKYIQKVVDLSNQLEPDLAVITGDFTEADNNDIHWSSEILSKIKAPLGIIAVLGNHDCWNGKDLIAESLEKSNIKVLNNANLSLSFNGQQFFVAGLDDYRVGQPDFKKAMENIPENSLTILLSHFPDALEFIENSKVDLLLSGHIHGGQIRFPFLGPIYIPSKYGEKHAWGLTKHNETWIYTSKGIGATCIPIRINCPPEIILLKLQKAI